MAAILLMSISNNVASKNFETKSIEISKETSLQKKKNQLMVRLNEINTMDKSNLSTSEKRHLRREVRTIEYQLKAAANSGVYISGAGIIIILILLIILL